MGKIRDLSSAKVCFTKELIVISNKVYITRLGKVINRKDLFNSEH